MESVIGLTDMKRTSSPPVDEGLVASSSKTDTAATEINGGVTEQKQENRNVNDDDDNNIKS